MGNQTIQASQEEKIINCGKNIFSLVKKSKSSFFDRSFWTSKLMNLGMQDQKLKVQLFRFVDVLPVIKNDEQLSKQIKEYFSDVEGDFAGIIGLATKLGTSSFVGKFAAAQAVKTGVSEMAKTFIAGDTIKEVTKSILNLQKNKMTFTVDILGEAVLSESEANYYTKLYTELIESLAKESKKWNPPDQTFKSPHGDLPLVNVSVKLSSLYSQIDPIHFDSSVKTLCERIRPMLLLAMENNVFIYFDMEDYKMKNIVFEVFKTILLEEDFKDWSNVGIVVQAYLKDSENDVKSLIDWTKKRNAPISVRLVKGAYWDYETIISNQNSWECPVFDNKHETDANYEKLSRILIDSYPSIHTAIASHNIRSLAHAKIYAEEKNLPKNAIEYQFLYGMADPIKEAFVELGERVRIYTPYGELIPGMAYLVRRLLENTANESFLKQGFHDGVNEDELLKSPELLIPLIKDINTKHFEFKNIPDTDFIHKNEREKLKKSISTLRESLGKKYPLIINNKEIYTGEYEKSINPSEKIEVIGEFSLSTIGHSEECIKVAKNAFEDWNNTPCEERANVLKNAASIMLEKRHDLSALIILETGKPWKEADGDVSEAIDFLNYYADEAVKLFTPQKIISPIGEDNYSFYQPKGVVAVISPWNFPLAIMTGMSSAAIACGNTVILKPAKQSSIIAYEYMNILIEAGLPPGVCNYLPGSGSIIGNYLVCHKDINLIAFTGSMEVGLQINKLAAEIASGQDFVKKVICEMGGKNAIIVDDSADLDEAVKAVIYSAFGYSGQKCSAASRVIVLENIYDSFIKRLIESTKSIKVGKAENPESYLGPVIDEAALRNALDYVDIGKKESKLALGGDCPSSEGFYINPTIFIDVNPDSRIAQEEIFAPVLSVIKAKDFNTAIEIANNVKFALTGGIFSRSPGNIEIAKKKFKVGNLYINRSCTGAKVARQPFGGFKMSGIGSKAGGKDYLLQFVEPRNFTENTMRRGFAPTS